MTTAEHPLDQAERERVDQPRDDAGRFASPSAEPTVGRTRELNDAGFKTLEQHEAKPEPEPWSAEQAAAEREAKRFINAPTQRAVDISPLVPEPLPENVSLTAEEAADRLTRHHKAQGQVEELNQAKQKAHDILQDLGHTPEQSEAEWQRYLQAHTQPQQEAPEDLISRAKSADQRGEWQQEWASWSAEQQSAYREATKQQQPEPRPGELSERTKQLIEQDPVLRQELQARFQQVEGARQQYETVANQAAEVAFADLLHDAKQLRAEGYDTYEKLVAADPKRALEYRIKTDRVSMLVRGTEQAQQQRRAEQAAQFREYAAKQDKAFVERVPEMADPAQRAEIQKNAAEYLFGRGFSADELRHAYDGGVVSIRDARIQEVIADAMRWRQAQAAKAAVAQKQIPSVPVMRPGVQGPRISGSDAQYAKLSRALEGATGSAALKIAHQMRQLRKGR
jgi:hypothetical protein